MATAATLLATARLLAGLNQREFARRVRTAQSVIARIESGQTSPSWCTLQRLLQVCGFKSHAELTPRSRGRTHMLDDAPRILRLTPEQRLQELRDADKLFFDAVPVTRAQL